MPWLSAGTTHKGRLFVCVSNTPGLLLLLAVADNFWVSPMLFLVNAFFVGSVLLMAWRYRDHVSERMLYVWQDPASSQLILSLNTYAIVFFHLFPLLFFGTAQTVAETLVHNVAGYFFVYLPVLDSHGWLTSLLSLYAAAACPSVIQGGAELTLDMKRILLFYVAFGSLLRLGLQFLQERVTPVNLWKKRQSFKNSQKGLVIFGARDTWTAWFLTSAAGKVVTAWRDCCMCIDAGRTARTSCWDSSSECLMLPQCTDLIRGVFNAFLAS